MKPTPIRWSLHQVKRATRLISTLPTVFQNGGGVVATGQKAFSILHREGWAGVKQRLRDVSQPTAFTTDEHGQLVGRNDYAEWIVRYDTLTDITRQIIRDKISALPRHPVVSIVMPVYNPPLQLLDEAIWSIRKQLYTSWEFCIADDASTNEDVRHLLKKHAAEDARIKVMYRPENGHISKASNSALELATGEYIALFDNDDLLPEHALFHVVEAVLNDPDAVIIYSDEDKLDIHGVRTDPYFKCDWNPELFLGHNLISHFGVYRTDHVKAIGGFRVGYEGSQDYDFAARILERIEPKQVLHIPRVLYHWRMLPGSAAMGTSEKPYAVLASEKALNEHLARRGVKGNVEALPIGMHRIHFSLPDTLPLVSIIIPTRNAAQLVQNCVQSIYQLTTYKNFEILLVDNGSDNAVALDLFRELERQHDNFRVIQDGRPFNYSALNNNAVKQAKGDLVCLLNNDIEVITPEWLNEMVSVATQERVGAVGAKLSYPNNRIQHAGVILGMGADRVAGHGHHTLPRNNFGYFSRAILTQELSAVTAACLVIKKSIYEQVGGLDEQLEVAFNDVDFCLKVREAGYRNIWTPHAELYHHESVSRGHEDNPEKQARFAKEAAYMRKRWGKLLMADPAYSPNLTLNHGDFSLAWPPRIAPLQSSNNATDS